MRYFHGSRTAFETGFALSGRGDGYARDWGETDFYAVLERWRPVGAIAHAEAVFMVGDPDEVDLAGGATEWCLELAPCGQLDRHDMNWSSEISCLMSEGHAVDSPEVRRAAQAYWAGEPHRDENLWEYLARSAVVLACEPWEDCAFAP